MNQNRRPKNVVIYAALEAQKETYLTLRVMAASNKDQKREKWKKGN